MIKQQDLAQQDLRPKHNTVTGSPQEGHGPGRMGSLISDSTRSQSPGSLSFEMMNLNLMNHVFLQCVLDIQAQNTFLCKSGYGTVC